MKHTKKNRRKHGKNGKKKSNIKTLKKSRGGSNDFVAVKTYFEKISEIFKKIHNQLDNHHPIKLFIVNLCSLCDDMLFTYAGVKMPTYNTNKSGEGNIFESNNKIVKKWEKEILLFKLNKSTIAKLEFEMQLNIINAVRRQWKYIYELIYEEIFNLKKHIENIQNEGITYGGEPVEDYLITIIKEIEKYVQNEDVIAYIYESVKNTTTFCDIIMDLRPYDRKFQNITRDEYHQLMDSFKTQYGESFFKEQKENIDDCFLLNKKITADQINEFNKTPENTDDKKNDNVSGITSEDAKHPEKFGVATGTEINNQAIVPYKGENTGVAKTDSNNNIIIDGKRVVINDPILRDELKPPSNDNGANGQAIEVGALVLSDKKPTLEFSKQNMVTDSTNAPANCLSWGKTPTKDDCKDKTSKRRALLTYHPDKNTGCESASATKFNELQKLCESQQSNVTDNTLENSAYEVTTVDGLGLQQLTYDGENPTINYDVNKMKLNIPLPGQGPGPNISMVNNVQPTTSIVPYREKNPPPVTNTALTTGDNSNVPAHVPVPTPASVPVPVTPAVPAPVPTPASVPASVPVTPAVPAPVIPIVSNKKSPNQYCIPVVGKWLKRRSPDRQYKPIKYDEFKDLMQFVEENTHDKMSGGRFSKKTQKRKRVKGGVNEISIDEIIACLEYKGIINQDDKVRFKETYQTQKQSMAPVTNIGSTTGVDNKQNKTRKNVSEPDSGMTTGDNTTVPPSDNTTVVPPAPTVVPPAPTVVPPAPPAAGTAPGPPPNPPVVESKIAVVNSCNYEEKLKKWKTNQNTGKQKEDAGCQTQVLRYLNLISDDDYNKNIDTIAKVNLIEYMTGEYQKVPNAIPFTKKEFEFSTQDTKNILEYLKFLQANMENDTCVILQFYRYDTTRPPHSAIYSKDGSGNLVYIDPQQRFNEGKNIVQPTINPSKISEQPNQENLTKLTRAWLDQGYHKISVLLTTDAYIIQFGMNMDNTAPIWKAMFEYYTKNPIQPGSGPGPGPGANPSSGKAEGEYYIEFTKDANDKNINRLVIRKVPANNAKGYDFLVYPDPGVKQLKMTYQDVVRINQNIDELNGIQPKYDQFIPPPDKLTSQFRPEIQNLMAQNTPVKPGSTLYIGLLLHGGYYFKTSATKDDYIPYYIENIPVKSFTKATLTPFGKVAWITTSNYTGSGTHKQFLSDIRNPTILQAKIQPVAKNGIQLAANMKEIFDASVTNKNLADSSGKLPKDAVNKAEKTPLETWKTKWQGFTFDNTTNYDDVSNNNSLQTHLQNIYDATFAIIPTIIKHIPTSKESLENAKKEVDDLKTVIDQLADKNTEDAKTKIIDFSTKCKNVLTLIVTTVKDKKENNEEFPENSERSGEFLRHSTDDDEGIGRTMNIAIQTLVTSLTTEQTAILTLLQNIVEIIRKVDQTKAAELKTKIDQIISGVEKKDENTSVSKGGAGGVQGDTLQNTNTNTIIKDQSNNETTVRTTNGTANGTANGTDSQSNNETKDDKPKDGATDETKDGADSQSKDGVKQESNSQSKDETKDGADSQSKDESKDGADSQSKDGSDSQSKDDKPTDKPTDKPIDETDNETIKKLSNIATSINSIIDLVFSIQNIAVESKMDEATTKQINEILGQTTTSDKMKIINKSFSSYRTDSQMYFDTNIYIIHGNGGVLEPWAKAGNPGILNKPAGFQYAGSHTEDLLNLAHKCGYENVVMIDVCCDSCTNIPDNDIAKKMIQEIRRGILQGTIGRG